MLHVMLHLMLHLMLHVLLHLMSHEVLHHVSQPLVTDSNWKLKCPLCWFVSASRESPKTCFGAWWFPIIDAMTLKCVK